MVLGIWVVVNLLLVAERRMEFRVSFLLYIVGKDILNVSEALVKSRGALQPRSIKVNGEFAKENVKFRRLAANAKPLGRAPKVIIDLYVTMAYPARVHRIKNATQCRGSHMVIGIEPVANLQLFYVNVIRQGMELKVIIGSHVAMV